MVTCPTCNAQNDPSAGFCDQCGTSLQGASLAPAPGVYSPPLNPNYSVGGVICPQCGAQVIPGEMFCENCGAALGSAPPAPATGGYAPPPLAAPPSPAPSYTPPPPVATAFLTGIDGQTFQLSGKTTYLIGRRDDVSGNYPDVDTSDAGLQAGVSRRHAELYQQGVQWFVRDLNSVNGTWVNQQRLASNGSEAINSGDTIRLGKWTVTFRI
ncbi:MAG: FHA domain-containing protein [Caldilineaceae bacterium]|nr:FHA domain-containing protein [Caldilineaceae bacterium]HRW46797.1 FHA domain-containing protein [Caldilinea sp.]